MGWTHKRRVVVFRPLTNPAGDAAITPSFSTGQTCFDLGMLADLEFEEHQVLVTNLENEVLSLRDL